MTSNIAHILAVTINEDFTKMLVTCSDRVLILYKIDFEAKNVFEELERFQDVINRKRWINTAFVRLEETTRIINDEDHSLTVDRTEPFTTDCISLVGQHHNYANTSREIFLGSSGENGANEIKFFNCDDCSGQNIKEIKKLEPNSQLSVDVSAHSGAHLSLAIATNDGSLYLW